MESKAWKENFDDPFPTLSRFRGKANRKLRTNLGKLIGTGFNGIERLKPGRHKYMFEKFIAAGAKLRLTVVRMTTGRLVKLQLTGP